MLFPLINTVIKSVTIAVFISRIPSPGLSSDLEYFRSCGADGVLLKPFNITDFNTAMRKLSLNPNPHTGHDPNPYCHPDPVPDP
jgi:hypothetical protein